VTSRFAIRKPEKAIDSIEAHELESREVKVFSRSITAYRTEGYGTSVFCFLADVN
jgi:hypothetical protein